MFTVIISEKGGAERREAFDKSEINVGRVQGNDLMLPKGNVSKHHARLLYRDGRFIVTDLKSTNGTYVNGRKIAQATIVREGDKIYVGDFVLRLDAGGSAAPQAEASYPPEEVPTGNPPARASFAPQPSVPPAPAYAPPVAQPHHAQASAPHTAPLHAPPVAPPPLAAPPPQPMAPALHQPTPGPLPPQRAAEPGRAQDHLYVSPDDSAPAPSQQGRPSGGRPATSRASSSMARAPSIPPPKQVLKESPQQAARRLALVTLMDRVADSADLGPLRESVHADEAFTSKLETIVEEQARALRAEGDIPESADAETLARDAMTELVGLGPLTALLQNDDITEIHVLRHDHVCAMRGRDMSLADVSFSSEESLARAVIRLCHGAGQPLSAGEYVVERTLTRGARALALLPPAADAPVLVIKKPRRIIDTLEDLVRAGALSRPMATFLDLALQARANLFVVASDPETSAHVLSALLAQGTDVERAVVIQDEEEITANHAQPVVLRARHIVQDPAALRVVAAAPTERILFASLKPELTGPVADLILEGTDGILCGLRAPSLRLGIFRTASSLSGRAGTALAARELVADLFDFAVEVHRLPDGRLRIIRIAELMADPSQGIAMRDLFTFASEGGEGAFVASGVTPARLADFAARGVRIDPNLFRRSVGRG